jgi:hemoglobin
MKNLFSAIALLAFGMAALSGVAQSAEKSLYERLGGKPAITAVVGQFVDNNNADEVIAHRWKSDRVHILKAYLVDLICQATGGPCVYTGKSMEIAHSGSNITEAEFNRVAVNLTRALDQFKVPAREKGELLAAISAMKNQVVGQ